MFYKYQTTCLRKARQSWRITSRVSTRVPIMLPMLPGRGRCWDMNLDPTPPGGATRGPHSWTWTHQPSEWMMSVSLHSPHSGSLPPRVTLLATSCPRPQTLPAPESLGTGDSSSQMASTPRPMGVMSPPLTTAARLGTVCGTGHVRRAARVALTEPYSPGGLNSRGLFPPRPGG